MVYKTVFREKAKEYKKLLDLSKKDNLRRTLVIKKDRPFGGFRINNNLSYASLVASDASVERAKKCKIQAFVPQTFLKPRQKRVPNVADVTNTIASDTLLLGGSVVFS